MVFHGVSEADITGFMEYHGMPAIDIGQTWIMPGMAIVFPFRFFFFSVCFFASSCFVGGASQA